MKVKINETRILLKQIRLDNITYPIGHRTYFVDAFIEGGNPFICVHDPDGRECEIGFKSKTRIKSRKDLRNFVDSISHVDVAPAFNQYKATMIYKDGTTLDYTVQ